MLILFLCVYLTKYILIHLLEVLPNLRYHLKLPRYKFGLILKLTTVTSTGSGPSIPFKHHLETGKQGVTLQRTESLASQILWFMRLGEEHST
jgi:hypothetical protein